ncbi:YtfJ family protein [Vibrio sp. FNV 38]|nr:YtfJ family protein [Vibrio sp. FNV 38]
MKIKSLLSTFLLITPLSANALNLEVDKTLPTVTINNIGELILEQDTIKYQSWNTEKMLGKVRVIQAIAGRGAAKEMNAPLMAALTAAEFPEEQYQTTTIINQDDALWGTGSFVKSSAEDSKKEFPWSSMVLDSDGLVANQWALTEKSSAIILQDKQGTILFIKEGALSEGEINNILTLIGNNLDN